MRLLVNPVWCYLQADSRYLGAVSASQRRLGGVQQVPGRYPEVCDAFTSYQHPYKHVRNAVLGLQVKNWARITYRARLYHGFWTIERNHVTWSLRLVRSYRHCHWKLYCICRSNCTSRGLCQSELVTGMILYNLCHRYLVAEIMSQRSCSRYNVTEIMLQNFVTEIVSRRSRYKDCAAEFCHRDRVIEIVS